MKVAPRTAPRDIPLKNSSLRICILAFVFCQIGSVSAFAETRGSAAPDQFIETVANIKLSVAPISCMRQSGAAVSFGGNVGTAFFVSAQGAFVTPSHVIELFLPGGTFADCIAAISLTRGGWHQGPAVWHGELFDIHQCALDHHLDVARCSTRSDLETEDGGVYRPRAVTFDTTIRPDGSEAAFTGFPLTTTIPITTRGYIAGYGSQGATIDELYIDKGDWPGSSGSPAFDGSGDVIGMVIKRTTGEAWGFAVCRPAYLIQKFLSEHPLAAP